MNDLDLSTMPRNKSTFMELSTSTGRGKGEIFSIFYSKNGVRTL